MADWATISSLATAGGTLVLAIATFSSVRSANRSAKLAEAAFAAQVRPLLLSPREDDTPQTIRWGDSHLEKLEGAMAIVAVVDTDIYLAFGVRNGGTGLAVLHSWRFVPEEHSVDAPTPDPSRFRRQTRDLYVSSGDSGFWQAAIRDHDDPFRADAERLIASRRVFGIDVLYGDHEGGQRTVSRFSLSPTSDDQWLCSVVRHWHLDRIDPREAI